MTLPLPQDFLPGGLPSSSVLAEPHSRWPKSTTDLGTGVCLGSGFGGTDKGKQKGGWLGSPAKALQGTSTVGEGWGAKDEAGGPGQMHRERRDPRPTQGSGPESWDLSLQHPFTLTQRNER